MYEYSRCGCVCARARECGQAAAGRAKMLQQVLQQVLQQGVPDLAEHDMEVDEQAPQQR